MSEIPKLPLRRHNEDDLKLIRELEQENLSLRRRQRLAIDVLRSFRDPVHKALRFAMRNALLGSPQIARVEDMDTRGVPDRLADAIVLLEAVSEDVPGTPQGSVKQHEAKILLGEALLRMKAARTALQWHEDTMTGSYPESREARTPGFN